MNLLYSPTFVVILYINISPLRAHVKNIQCIFGSNFGIRNDSFCHVVIQRDVTGKDVSVESGARLCLDYKGVVDHYIVSATADVLPGLGISLGANISSLGIYDSQVVG